MTEKKNTIILFSILTILLVLFTIYILIPSYINYHIACNALPDYLTKKNTTLEKANLTDFEKETDFVIYGAWDGEEASVFLDEGSEGYNRTLKHELCHKNQEEQGRLYGCKFPIGVILNEVECKIKERI